MPGARHHPPKVGLPGPVPRRVCVCGEWLPHACDQPAAIDESPSRANGGAVAGLGETVCRRILAARKIQALAYIAWPPGELAGRLGIPLGMFLGIRLGKPPAGRGSALSPELYGRICCLFAQLEGTRGPSSSSARDARKRRWAPPLAWGDADEAGHWIEDPAAVPVPDWKRPGRADPGALADHLAEMFGRRYSIDGAALHMGLTRRALDKRISRARRRGSVIVPLRPQQAEYTGATG